MIAFILGLLLDIVKAPLTMSANKPVLAKQLKKEEKRACVQTGLPSHDLAQRDSHHHWNLRMNQNINYPFHVANRI